MKFTGSIAVSIATGPTVISLLQACKNEIGNNWKPEFLTDEEKRFVSTLADMILPRTDTPGALDVKADMFIDKVIAHVFDEEGQKSMRDSISKFNADCKANFGDAFVNLSDKDRAKVLRQEEEKRGLFNQSVWGTAVGFQEPVGFYRSLKSMVLWAYFSSEKVGKQVLNYDPVPGVYKGCIPVSEVGNKWSL